MFTDTLLDAGLAYLHFVSIFFTGFFLLLEWVRCRDPISLNRAMMLAKVDGAYGATAMLVVATGFLRVFYGAKGSEFYLDNPVFYTKVFVFILVAILSVPVTLAFRRWKKSLVHEAVSIPTREINRVRAYLIIQIVLLAFIPALGVLMARGLGLN